MNDLTIGKGAKVRLRCDTPDCFVGDVEVTSKGGAPTHTPWCPSCQNVMAPQGEIIPAAPETWLED